MLKSLSRTAAALAITVGLAGCGDSTSGAQGYYMLLDTSGTYSGELQHAQKIILAILTRLDPGDSFAVARIDTGSFSEKTGRAWPTSRSACSRRKSQSSSSR